MSDGDDDSRSVVSSARYTDGGTQVRSSSGRRSLRKLAESVAQLLCHEDQITSKEHLQACQALAELMRTLNDVQEVSKQVQVFLMCTVSSLLRRVVRMRDDVDAAQSSKFEERDFCKTLTLVFVAIVSVDLIAREGVPVNPESSQRSLDESQSGCLWAGLCRHSKRKAVAEEVDEFEKRRIELEELCDRPYNTDASRSSWSSMLTSPSSTASSALQLAGWLVFRSSSDDLQTLKQLAFTFARATAAQMHSQLLNGREDASASSCGEEFLTLGTRDVLAQTNSDELEEAIEGIISAAESETGQTLIRDIVTSFIAPRKLVGVRRELLLSREVSEKISTDFPWIAALAHEAAMAGAEYLWKNSKSELKRTCALLAGLAVLSTHGSGEDLARKSRAFGGRVQLPFLETAPAEDALTMALVQSRRSWVLYRVEESGRPNVTLSKRGFDGLLAASIAFRNDLFK